MRLEKPLMGFFWVIPSLTPPLATFCPSRARWSRLLFAVATRGLEPVARGWFALHFNRYAKVARILGVLVKLKVFICFGRLARTTIPERLTGPKHMP